MPDRVPCILCRKSDGPFTSREHPIPESIGNHAAVLPVGVVCDGCNHDVPSGLDQALTDFVPLKIRRTTLGVATKAGKVPHTAFQDGRWRHNGRFAEIVGDLNPRSWHEEARSTRDPRYSVGIATLSGGRPLRGHYAEQISRALLKVGFGCAWIAQRKRLLDGMFDAVRAVIRGKTRRGFIFVASAVDERNTSLDVRYDAFADDMGVGSLRVYANFYGIAMVTDSRVATPPSALADLGAVATFGEPAA